MKIPLIVIKATTEAEKSVSTLIQAIRISDNVDDLSMWVSAQIDDERCEVSNEEALKMMQSIITLLQTCEEHLPIISEWHKAILEK